MSLTISHPLSHRACPQTSKKSRLLKFCNVPDTSACSSKGIFAAATNSTNQANKAGSTGH